MKPCSNPTCTHQVEDDARFCGMCGAYVGPELTSHTTLIDVLAHRIQQCRDLLNSLQSEPDEKGKAQKIRVVMNILTSITTDQLPGKPIAHGAEQIQLLSTVVQEMLALPSISPTASAADMQHWPVSPLEMRQWTELLIALAGSNNFSSLDQATKSAVREALGRFISFVGIHARSDPDTELFLLDLYESITALSAPELESCFLGMNKSKLLRRLEQRIQSSLSSASPSVSPDEVKLFGQLAAEGLSATEIPQAQELEDRTNDVLAILEQAARLGETQPALAVATAEALTALLEMRGQNRNLRHRDAVLRLRTVDDLTRTAWTSAVTHQRDVPVNILAVIGNNMLDVLATHHVDYLLSFEDRLAAAGRYVQLLDAVAQKNQHDPKRKEEIREVATEFASRCGSMITQLEFDGNRTVSGPLSELRFRRLR